jgi:hypothetical protein
MVLVCGIVHEVSRHAYAAPFKFMTQQRYYHTTLYNLRRQQHCYLNNKRISHSAHTSVTAVEIYFGI